MAVRFLRSLVWGPDPHWLGVECFHKGCAFSWMRDAGEHTHVMFPTAHSTEAR